MSYVDTHRLVGVNDPSLSYFTTVVPLSAAKTTLIDGLTQYQAYIRKFRIVNESPTSSIAYKVTSKDAVTKNCPPASAVAEDGWESYLQIGSGVGYVELELIERRIAERK